MTNTKLIIDEISDFLQRLDINISIDIAAIETSIAINTNLTIPLQRELLKYYFLQVPFEKLLQLGVLIYLKHTLHLRQRAFYNLKVQNEFQPLL